MLKRFVFAREDRPDEAWLARFAAGRDAGPDRAPAASRVRVCANHQERVAAPQSAALSRSIERQEVLLAALDDPATTLPDLIARFLEPPIYSRRAGFTTAYSAVYRPAERRVDYLWPGKIWRQRIGGFEPGEYTHDYGELIP
jgi:predicted choloylglycine hydrolase